MGSMPGSLCRAFGVGGLGVLRLGVCGFGNCSSCRGFGLPSVQASLVSRVWSVP